MWIAVATTVTMVAIFECQALFRTASSSAQNLVTVNFDAPPGGGRVVDVATGALDCTATCSVPLPTSQSPIRLRPINQGATWSYWYNCDNIVADVANPGGPQLCQIDITAGPRTVTVEFGL